MILFTGSALLSQYPSLLAAEAAEVPAVRIQAGGDAQERGVGRDELLRRQASQTSEIFRGDASVEVGGGSRNAQRLYLRGLESSNLNVTVDGARQGRDLHQHRGGATNLDPELLQSVELDPHPSADQGPGALGGGVRFRTVDAQDLLGPDEDTGFRLSTGYATADSSERGSATGFQRLGRDWGALAHISGTNRDDYEVGGGGTMPFSGGRDRSYMAQASRVPADGHELRLGVQRHSYKDDSLYGGPGSDTGDPRAGYRGDPESQEQKRDTWTVEHRYQPEDPHIHWQARAYRNDNRLERLDEGTETRAVEHGGDLRNTFTLHAGPTRHRLTTGFDYYSEDARLQQEESPDLSQSSRNFGAFLQNRLDWERLHISTGLRFDDYVTNLGGQELDGDAVSPNLSAELALPAGWSVFGGYGEAVSGAGGTIPIGWLQRIDADATQLEGIDSLRAEKSRRGEGGLRYQGRDLVTAGDRARLEVTAFETRIENSLTRADGGPPHPYIEGLEEYDVQVRGYELRVNWGAGSYDTRLSFLSAETEDEDGNPLGVIRRQSGSGGDRLAWDHQWSPHETLILGYTLTWVGNHTDVPDDQPERDGYQTHDVQAQWRPWADERLTLGLVVNNLLDEDYAEHTSLAFEEDGDLIVREEPGRDLRVKATMQF
nr:TonB-dependent receptor plug domain-containing protein [Halorhodospira sp. 9621]